MRPAAGRVPPEPAARRAEPTSAKGIVVASDVGGTFTDTVLMDQVSGRTWSLKVPTRARHQEDAVARGAKAVLAAWSGDAQAGAGQNGQARCWVHHGSTMATNALIEGRGAAIAFVTNEGFEDVVAIGRQDRPDLYDLDVVGPETLVARDRCFGVPLRRGPAGEAWGADDGAVTDAIGRVTRAIALLDPPVEAMAVGLLHADLYPDDEVRVADMLRAAWPATAGDCPPIIESHRVWPEMREVERYASALVDAKLVPVMRPYMDRFEAALDRTIRSFGKPAGISVMDSSASLRSLADASDNPGALLLSGPAGGVRAAASLGAALALGQLVAFDVGGTSTDVSFLEASTPDVTTQTKIAGHTFRAPSVDIHTLGAGGGSIIWVDTGGHIQVGPRSQGAAPGPACYGLGGEVPTLTDALVALGRIPRGAKLGARLEPDRDLALRALDSVADAARTEAIAAAWAAFSVTIAATAGGVHVVTTRRGHDPRGAALVAYGGAGPMLAAEMAQSLGMNRVIVPWDAGTFSARGIATAPFVRRAAVGLDWRSDRISATEDAPFAATWDRALDVLAAQESQATAPSERSADHVRGSVAMRYVGQSYELEVEASRDMRAVEARDAFVALHRERYGHTHDDRPVEAVRLLVEAVAPTPDPGWSVPPIENGNDHGDLSRPDGIPYEAAVVVAGPDMGFVEVTASIMWRSEMAPGQTLVGPIIVADATATTFVPPGWRVIVDAATRALVMDRNEVVA